ncbi:MAG: hypothetical protein IPK22_26195 [Verrucomicrobiaceae bacterium]|nr:hypothetical protein [Verrucomicrobiaceae bacterium]
MTATASASKGSAASTGRPPATWGSWERANDLRFPGGRVHATGFETMQHQILAAMRLGAGVLTVDTSYVRTRDSGTPTLPMDMIEDGGVRLGLRYTATHDFGTVEARAYIHTIDHLMNNYSLRPLPGKHAHGSPPPATTSATASASRSPAVPTPCASAPTSTGMNSTPTSATSSPVPSRTPFTKPPAPLRCLC